MRTTVTLDSADLSKLLKTTGLKSKAKAVAYAVGQALRLKEIERLEALRGKVGIDRKVLKWRSLGR